MYIIFNWLLKVNNELNNFVFNFIDFIKAFTNIQKIRYANSFISDEHNPVISHLLFVISNFFFINDTLNKLLFLIMISLV